VVHFKQGIIMSLGGGETQSPVAGSNKYAEIMELMRRQQAMNNSTYTGGFNPYVVAAPSRPYDDLIARQASANREFGPGGGSELGRGGFDGYGGVNTNRGLIEGILSSATLGRIGNFFGSKQDPTNVTVEDRTGTPTAAAIAKGNQSISDMAEAEGVALGPAATGDGGYGMTPDGGIDGSMFNKGGQVTMNRLLGPNPMGPDDGYGGLDDGEYVINAKSVGKYGIELMNAINNGKISKGKLRGLLEA
jgi:hypothetical protein